MSIASALNNAGTGLRAASKLADTVSNNVANAMTPGYARRATALSSLTLGGYGSGVQIVGTVRAENVHVTAERRALDAAAGAAATLGAAHERILAAIGEPGSPAALATRATQFETALLGAANSPSSHAKLAQVAEAASALARAVTGIAAEAVRMRTEADAEIDRQVGTLNRTLHAIEALNAKIRLGLQQGVDVSNLEDERGRRIDAIAEIVPVRTVKREQGEVAIYTANGGALLDGRVWELSFARGPAVITPDVVVGAGLSGLAQHRGDPAGPVPVPVATGTGFFDGGSLAALFEVRDQLVPALDAELNAYVADLMARFDGLPGGVPGQGLFVDPDPGGPPEGLAGRLRLDSSIDPAAGGEVWRLRDGIGAAAPGPEGFGDFLQAMADAMAVQRAPVGFATTSAANGSAGFAAEIGAFFGGQAARGDEARAYLSAQRAILAERETGALGVDTDAELQFLMLVEQAYAANARVLTVVDALLKQLLEI